MAGTPVLRFSGVCNDNMGYEVWDCAPTGVATTAITPSSLKSIEFVTISPTNATAATAAKGYVTSFVPGAPTVTVTTVTGSTFLCKIEGKRA